MDFLQIIPYSWTYSWNNQVPEYNGDWCYFLTNLPQKYTGGLALHYTEDKQTNVALRYTGSGTVDRYFNKQTIKSNALSLSGDIAIINAQTFEVFIQQTDGEKIPRHISKDNKFKIEIKRVTSWDLV